MRMADMETENKYSGDNCQDRRSIEVRRVNQGRGDMMRFDKTGGDRRSGNTRHCTDESFRVQSDGDWYVDETVCNSRCIWFLKFTPGFARFGLF